MSETRQCGWCLNPYEHQPRPPIEIETLRRSLFICNGSEPSICDHCFTMVMETAPPQHWVETVPTFALRVT